MYNDDDFKDEEEQETSQSDNKILDFYYANKKLIWILGGIIIFIIVSSLFMGGCSNSSVAPVEPELIISSNSEKLSINNSTQLFAKIEGNNQAVFNWTTSDPNVATVNSNGNNDVAVVTGINYGTAIITVTYVQDGKTYSQKCEVVVAEGNPNVNITQINFQTGELMISVGDTFKLPVIVTPTDGYMKGITFMSYNKDIVEIDENGLVKALKVGKTAVKVTVNNEFTSEINVHVLDKRIVAQVVINPTSIQFLDNHLKVEIGESLDLEYDYQPYDAVLADLIWKSSDSTVATVTNGIVTGVKAGQAEITVEALNGLTSVMSVEVLPKTISVESIQIMSNSSITLNIGATSSIVANVIPADATNKTLNYQSSNPSIASVDSNGNVRAISAGNAQITITSVDGGKNATVNVIVVSNSSSGGSSSGGSSSGGSSSGVGMIKFRDANENSIANSVSSALENNNKSPITVSRSSGSVTKLKYCVQKCTNSDDCSSPTCTPNTEIEMGESIKITQGNGIYVIKSIKYNGSLSEDVKLKYVNIGGVTTLGGTSSGSSSGDEACYLIGSTQYKWTTESEAKKIDENALLVKSRDTKSKCEGSGSSTVISKSFSINKEVKAYNSTKSGYITRLRFIGNNLKKVYYCYGSCSINTSNASSASAGSGTFGTLGSQTYYKSAVAGKTYYFSVGTTPTKYFYASGSSTQSVKFKAEYSDGTYSVLSTVSLTPPAY